MQQININHLTMNIVIRMKGNIKIENMQVNKNIEKYVNRYKIKFKIIKIVQKSSKLTKTIKIVQNHKNCRKSLKLSKIIKNEFSQNEDLKIPKGPGGFRDHFSWRPECLTFLQWLVELIFLIVSLESNTVAPAS